MADIYENNDSFLSAYNLQALSGLTTFQGLDIDTSGDDDWFSFTTLGTGQGNSNISLSFEHALGDIDLLLYDASENFISVSNGTSNSENISLAGLAAGTYYIRVYGYAGATNPNYTLSINAPITDDIYEDNDSQGQAANLGPVSGTLSLQNLVVRDQDWFQFSLGADGQVGDQLQIDFLHSLGDVDLALYSPSGYISGSTGIGNSEVISLAGLSAGTYFAYVYGYAGAQNSYSLSITANPSDDAYENNDSRLESTLLGTVTGNQSISNLAIQDDDWFQFNLASTGQNGNAITVDFQHAFGDVDIQLYDASGNLLTGSYGVVNGESISLAGLASGSYYLRVYGYAGAQNPSYSIHFNAPNAGDDRYEDNDTRGTASPIGNISGSLTLENLIITSGDSDWYEFTVTQPGQAGDAVSLAFDHNLGDVDLAIYNGAGSYVGGSFGVDNNELFSLAGLAAGTYYAHVYGYAGASNPNYTLTIFAGDQTQDDFFEDNDSRLTATDLRSVVGVSSLEDLVILSNDEDWFRFELPAAGQSGDTVRAYFSHALGDIDMILYDANGNYLNGSFGISDNESISLAGLATGVYYVQVYGYAGADNPSYTLEIDAPDAAIALPDAYEPNDTSTSAVILREDGTLTGLSVHAAGNEDWFQFTLQSDGGANDFVSLSFLHANGDIDMALYAYDETNTLTEIRYSNGVGNSESISLDGLVAGDYFVQIYGYAGATNPNYSLTLNGPVEQSASINPDFAEVNNSLSAAYNLGTLRGETVTPNLNIHTSGDGDWFQFTTSLAGEVTVQLDFEHDLGDVDLELYAANGDRLGGSYSIGDSESITQNLAAGQYFIHAYGYNGATNPVYTLSVDAPSTPNPDLYEVNDTRTTATEIRDLSTSLSNLSIHSNTDQDWFKFTTTTVGTASNQVFIEFEHDLGDLQLQLYNSDGQAIASSNGAGDTEQIALNGLAAGTYYARVRGVNASTNANYNLTLNAPAAQPAQDAWTVLVYVAADNDLEVFGSIDVNEMESVNLPDNVNVVVQMDRIPGFDTSNGNWTDTRRGLIQHDSNTSLISSNLASIGEVNMGNPSTLQDFLSWGVQNYAAQNYALVIWDHGAGLPGVAWDTTSSNDRLSMAEITQAIQGANVPNLQLVGFDACLMAMVEQGYELSTLTDVMVASQQIEPGDGWDYAGFLQQLATNPNSTAEQLGAAIVDSYGAFYNNRHTLSAIRTEAYTGLVSALTNFTNTVLSNASSQDWDVIGSARDATPYHDDWYRNDRDLGQFMTRIASQVSNTAIANAATGVNNALQSTVIKQINGLGFNGLGIYLPPFGGNLESSYNGSNYRFVENTNWDDFLNALTNRQQRSRTVASGDYAETNDLRGNVIRANNDTRSESFNIEQLVGADHRFSRLNLHRQDDRDWFRFETLDTGTGGDRVSIHFNHDDGDINLELYNQAGSLLSQSTSTTDQETITLDGRAAGQYFIRVVGANNTVTNPDYTLEIDAPQVGQIPEDWAERNDSFAQAVSLGSGNINQGQRFVGLTMEDQSDFFSVGSVRGTDFAINTVSIQFNNAAGNLDLRVYDQNRVLIGQSRTNNDIETVSFSSQTQGIYIRVYGRDGVTNPQYELSIGRNYLDIDGNVQTDALTDGLLGLAYLGGSNPDELTTYLGTGAGRPDGQALTNYLNDARSGMLDVDNNGVADAATDGQIILGYLLGAPSHQLLDFLGNGATRTTADQIIAFLDQHQPTFVQ